MRGHQSGRSTRPNGYVSASRHFLQFLFGHAGRVPLPRSDRRVTTLRMVGAVNGCIRLDSGYYSVSLAVARLVTGRPEL